MLSNLSPELTWIIIAVGVLNVITFVVYWFDKWMARSHSWRVPELVLWGLALIGGSIGALLAVEGLRHKNKKLSFQFVLWLIVLLQVGIGAGYYWFFAIK